MRSGRRGPRLSPRATRLKPGTAEGAGTFPASYPACTVMGHSTWTTMTANEKNESKRASSALRRRACPGRTAAEGTTRGSALHDSEREQRLKHATKAEQGTIPVKWLRRTSTAPLTSTTTMAKRNRASWPRTCDLQGTPHTLPQSPFAPRISMMNSTATCQRLEAAVRTSCARAPRWRRATAVGRATSPAASRARTATAPSTSTTTTARRSAASRRP